eukprot:g14852.t1
MLPRPPGAGLGLTGGKPEVGLGLGEGGSGGSPAALTAAPMSNGKGPKSFFRLRILSCRKLVAMLAVGLCVLAGGRRLFGHSREEEGGAPKLRGPSRSVGEVLASGETRYCNAPLDYPLARRPSPVGVDKENGGTVAPPSGLELRQLQVTIRHGDRSAIHELPNANEKRWKCQPFSEEIRRKWEDVSRFSVVNVDGRPLERPLTPAVYEKDDVSQLGREFQNQAGVWCKQGQLTETGIRQHLALGDQMRKAYQDVLGGGDLGSEEIYIRSTDYTRTLESAAAFLMSFFPGSYGMTIITDQDANAEVMHGIGLKAIGSERGGGGPEKITLGACDRAAKLSQAQIREFKPRTDVVADLEHLFGEEVLELKMTSIADSMHALSCHNMTLPCSDKGCVSPNLALSVMAEADRQMCMKYNGASGGGEASMLSLYPFTHEILTNMREALSGETSMKFALFSGHDTVVAPLLAALGAYDCRWPPYASHVAFELWSKPSGSGGGEGKDEAGRALREDARAGGSVAVEAIPRTVSVKDGGDDAAATSAAGGGRRRMDGADGGADIPSGDGMRAGGQLGQDEGSGEAWVERTKRRAVEAGRGDGEEEAYVRVTFQGQPVTHRIMDCSSDPLEGPYGREFCPISKFAKTIARALGSHDTLEQACQEV